MTASEPGEEVAEMSNAVLDVTLTATLARCGPEGELPLSDSEFNDALDEISKCLHSVVDDACVSGQASTGEVEMWFLVLNARTMPTALRRAADIVRTVADSANLQWRAAGTPELSKVETLAMVGSQMRHHLDTPKALTTA